MSIPRGSLRDRPFFFAPSKQEGTSSHITLPADEAKHAVQVLRRRAGDIIEVVDGEGNWYRVRLDAAEKSIAAGTVLEHRRNVNEPAFGMCIGLALLKQRQRWEWFLEKAVELGVTAIIPLMTARTLAHAQRKHRTQQVLIAAMKQSHRCRLVQIAEPAPLEDFFTARTERLKMIAHERASAPLSTVLKSVEAGSVCVAIGPEGGFSSAEIRTAERNEFEAVSLGPRRLRSETAAVAVAAAVGLQRGPNGRSG